MRSIDWGERLGRIWVGRIESMGRMRGRKDARQGGREEIEHDKPTRQTDTTTEHDNPNMTTPTTPNTNTTTGMY
jgi:hypothetical protein